MKKIEINLQLQNVGPHTLLNFINNCSNLKLAIYGNNGNGKSFISRMFSLAENNDLQIDKTNSYITLKQDKCKFEFNIINNEDPTKVNRQLKIDIERGKVPILDNQTNYIFHVFNSDYVKNNIEKSNYVLNDEKIDGYILGKINIDLSKERQNLFQKNKEQEDLKAKLSSSTITVKDKLDELNINKNTNEYRQITFESLFNEVQIEKESFQSLKQKLLLLKQMPEKQDIPIISIPAFNNIDINEIQEFLITPISPSSVGEDFKSKIKSKEQFIESGLNIYNGSNENKCPFCEQTINDKAEDLINHYLEYFKAEEAKARTKIDGYIKKINDAKALQQLTYSNFLSSKSSYEDVKKYFPSFQSNELPLIDKNNNFEYESMIKLLENKKDNLSNINYNIIINYRKIEESYKKLIDNLKIANNFIEKLNLLKNNQHSEQLQLNRRTCIAAFNEEKNKNQNDINTYHSLTKEINKIKEDIEGKQDSVKISKKDKVIKDLEFFLNYFFKDKYSFDESNFCIKFKNENSDISISDILSDGEKNIVSLCFFFAETNMVGSNNYIF
jgi:hypothetical protein